MNFSKDFNYNDPGDYLYSAEYYQFLQSSTLNTFKVELLCFDNSYAFHLISDNESTPKNIVFFQLIIMKLMRIFVLLL